MYLFVAWECEQYLCVFNKDLYKHVQVYYFGIGLFIQVTAEGHIMVNLHYEIYWQGNHCEHDAVCAMMCVLECVPDT